MSPRACVHGFFEVSYLPVENPSDEYMYFSKVHSKLSVKLNCFPKYLCQFAYSSSALSCLLLCIFADT